MHAVVFHVDLDPDFAGDPERELDEVVSLVAPLPGFVRGTWATDGMTGVSFLLFKTEQVARSVAENASMPPDASARLRSVAVYEVAREV